jgi:hypothetical protein
MSTLLGLRHRPGSRLPSLARWYWAGRNRSRDIGRHDLVGLPARFPSGGYWEEVFNSGVYDIWVNPIVAGKWWLHRCVGAADARLCNISVGGDPGQWCRRVCQVVRGWAS